MRVEADVMAAGAVVAFVVALSFVARGIQSSPATDASPRGRELLAQSVEWLRIADGTSVPLFAYRHTVFAMAYLNAARHMCPDEELQRGGTDIYRLANRLETRMLALSKKVGKVCAGANPEQEKPTNVTWV